MWFLKRLFPIFFTSEDVEETITKQIIEFPSFENMEETADDLKRELLLPEKKIRNGIECSFIGDLKSAIEGHDRAKARKQYTGYRSPIKGIAYPRIAREMEMEKNKQYMETMLNKK